MIREIEELESTNPYQKSIEFYNDNDEVIGYLVYSLIYDRIEVDNFFVKENYRNKGIGTKIMSYLICIAINNHVVNITLEVRKSNEIVLKQHPVAPSPSTLMSLVPPEHKWFSVTDLEDAFWTCALDSES